MSDDHGDDVVDNDDYGELPTRIWVSLCVVPVFIRVVIEGCCDGDDIDHYGYSGEVTS